MCHLNVRHASGKCHLISLSNEEQGRQRRAEQAAKAADKAAAAAAAAAGSF